MERIITIINKSLNYFAVIILVGIMIITNIDVFGRFLFNQPLKGTFELTELGLALMVFFALGYTHLKNEHITIDFIIEKLPPKIQYMYQAFVNILIVFLMIIISFQLWKYSQRLLNSNSTTGDLALPVHLFVLVTVAGTIAFSLAAALKAYLSLRKGGNEQ